MEVVSLPAATAASLHPQIFRGLLPAVVNDVEVNLDAFNQAAEARLFIGRRRTPSFGVPRASARVRDGRWQSNAEMPFFDHAAAGSVTLSHPYRVV